MRQASSTEASGRFIRMYFLRRLTIAESMRNRISSSVACSSADSSPDEMSTASEKKTCSTSRKPLETKVPPEETMSKMASAMSAAGAISTEPVITSMRASMPCSCSQRFRMPG